MMYYKDLEYLQETICKYVSEKLSDMQHSPKCSEMAYGYQKIEGCSVALRNALPVIKMQLGSYIYQMRPSQYIDLQ